MKIAVTADLHLRGGRQERFDNLERICRLLAERKIDHLVIAGDLFDSGFRGYLDFDSLAGKYGKLRFHLVPGNHDPGVRQSLFNSGNIDVYDRPRAAEIGGRQALFLPFREGSTMGAVIEQEGLAGGLRKGEWVLFSHGDFGRINRTENGNEQGYFPVTTGDLQRLSPGLVVLGHIHKPSELTSPVMYPGSPWPLDINETGPRRLLLVDTGTGAVESVPLDFTPVYEHAALFIIPDGNEMEQVRTQLETNVTALEKDHPGAGLRERLRVRVFLRGYTLSRQDMVKRVEDLASSAGIALESVDIDGLGTADDPDLNTLAVEVNRRIEEFSRQNRHGSDFIRSLREKAQGMIYNR